MFDGGQVTCWQMQSFFERNKVHKDSKNCRIFQSLNHICGCQGTGYAGASTTAKQKALVWVPRLVAIMSLLVRYFVCVCSSVAVVLSLIPKPHLAPGVIVHHIPHIEDTAETEKNIQSNTHHS